MNKENKDQKYAFIESGVLRILDKFVGDTLYDIHNPDEGLGGESLAAISRPEEYIREWHSFVEMCDNLKNGYIVEVEQFNQFMGLVRHVLADLSHALISGISSKEFYGMDAEFVCSWLLKLSNVLKLLLEDYYGFDTDGETYEECICTRNTFRDHQ